MTHLVPLAQALSPLRDVYQHLISAAVRWQDGRPRRADPDQFVLICVAADAAPGGTASPTRWTRSTVYGVLRRDVPTWCSLHRCPWPADLPEAMWEWLDFLSDTGRLDGASDPLWELRKPLLCYGGLDPHGRQTGSHGTGPPGGPPGSAPSSPPPVACECDLPYRETAALLNRLGRRCAGRGRGALDVLRALLGDDPHRDAGELDTLLPGLWDHPPDGGRDGFPAFPDEDPPWS
jgi:hypothetical protein